tara:strand:+ start:8853 stop:10946 length:2094 start_codon:yes stop_codon:yes gene_type:complete
LSISYRPEIDGLRALAILPVVLFHAGLPYFEGGYLGVDVFFVISGYLITTIISQDINKGNFTIVGFYERRARRILPALVFVCIACSPAAYFLLMPQELSNFGQSLISISVFSSNIFFWLDSGYFSVDSDLKPLLHTWSLAVEEQFYLAYPLILLALREYSMKTKYVVMILGLVASLCLSQFGQNLHTAFLSNTDYSFSFWSSPSYAFFSLPTRGWELLVGCIAGLYLSNPHNSILEKSGDILALCGLTMIVGAMIFFEESTPHPSLYTTIPVVGSVLCILYGTKDTWTGKFLSSSMFVGVGLISYSTYLWHQPLFAFTRIANGGQSISLFVSALIILSSFLFGFLSWKYIEAPFRNRSAISKQSIFYLSGISLVIIAAVGFYLMNLSTESRYSPQELGAFQPAKENQSGICSEWNQMDGFEICSFGDTSSNLSMLIYGDSHAAALMSELETLLLKNKVRGVRIKPTDCEMIPGLFRKDHLQTPNEKNIVRCQYSLQKMLEFSEAFSVVVVHIRWTYQLYPIADQIEDLGFNNQEGAAEHLPAREYLAFDGANFTNDGVHKADAVNDFLTQFNKTAQLLVLIYPVPELGFNLPRHNFQSHRAEGSVPETVTTSSEVFRSRNAFVTGILDSFNSPKLIRVHPSDLLCDTSLKGRCIAQKSTIPLYYDDNHLSNAGALLVLNRLFLELESAGLLTKTDEF